MKKILLLSLVFAGFTANSQSFEIKDDNNNVINGQLVSITGSNAPFSTISGHAKVKNTSSQDLDVKVKRYELNVVPASQNYFCWFVCYGAITAGDKPLFPTVSDPQFNHFRTIEADSTDNSLAFYHKPEGTTGTSLYRYVVFDGNNPNDSAYFDAEFVVGFDGVNELPTINTNHYPNPANNNLTITIDGKTSGLNLIVTDLLGKTVANKSNLSGINNIDLANYNNGIYFYSITNSKGVLTTRKFIVKH